MNILIIILVVVLLTGGCWGYTAGPWREGPVYWPGGLIGILVLILLLKLLGIL